MAGDGTYRGKVTVISRTTATVTAAWLKVVSSTTAQHGAGYRIYNGGANALLVRELAIGATAPTDASTRIAASYSISAGNDRTEGLDQRALEVYVRGDGAVTCDPVVIEVLV